MSTKPPELFQLRMGLDRCKNCNTTKSDKDPPLGDWLIPDRDNTFAAYEYREDGVIDIQAGVPAAMVPKARVTLDMMGLNREVRETLDERGNLVALDRRRQRLEQWLMAKRYRKFWDAAASSVLEQAITDLARTNGFFSIWMAAFDGVLKIRKRLIQEFVGTEMGCFDPVTTQPVSPAPNPDGLANGKKV